MKKIDEETCKIIKMVKLPFIFSYIIHKYNQNQLSTQSINMELPVALTLNQLAHININIFILNSVLTVI